MFRVELKKQREIAGLSQYRLAEKIGVSQATVGMWESGKREPNFTTICQLADFFGISVDELLGRSSIYRSDIAEEQKETPILNSEDERNVVRMAGRDGSYVVRRLSDEQYAAFKALLEQLPDADF